jgi:hypothetical protein
MASNQGRSNSQYSAPLCLTRNRTADDVQIVQRSDPRFIPSGSAKAGGELEPIDSRQSRSQSRRGRTRFSDVPDASKDCVDICHGSSSVTTTPTAKCGLPSKAEGPASEVTASRTSLQMLLAYLGTVTGT